MDNLIWVFGVHRNTYIFILSNLYWIKTSGNIAIAIGIFYVIAGTKYPINTFIQSYQKSNVIKVHIN